MAEWYDAHVRSGHTPHDLAVATTLGLAGKVAGLRVLDVACGPGLAARALARAGARVIGTDITPEMLDAARTHEAAEPLGITYVGADAQNLTGLPDHAFD